MKILLVGATGSLGTAVGKALTDRGHEVVTVGRTAGDNQADVADPEQTARVFAQVTDLDAVASAAGAVPCKRVVDMAPEDYLSAYRGKVAAQIEVVRQGIRHVAERGSFTLITDRRPGPGGREVSLEGMIAGFTQTKQINVRLGHGATPTPTPRTGP